MQPTARLLSRSKERPPLRAKLIAMRFDAARRQSLRQIKRVRPASALQRDDRGPAVLELGECRRSRQYLDTGLGDESCVLGLPSARHRWVERDGARRREDDLAGRRGEGFAALVSGQATLMMQAPFARQSRDRKSTRLNSSHT